MSHKAAQYLWQQVTYFLHGCYSFGNISSTHFQMARQELVFAKGFGFLTIIWTEVISHIGQKGLGLRIGQPKPLSSLGRNIGIL